MRPLLLLALLPLAACATTRGDRGPVALDQTQDLGRVSVTPIKVEEDSRCPENARCAEPGKLVVRAVVDGWGFSQLERQFTLGRPVAVDGRRWLVLDGAEPGPSQELTAFTGRYRFHFAEVPPPPGG
jgi:hypothetical protein